MVDGKKGKGGLESMLAENYLPMETSKMRLKNFLSDGPGSAAKGHDNTANMLGTEPIADFFPNTTVLYADLSGFTAWSSTREPSQVFTLLETLYGAMDKAARRLGVFKVETIGDCYVAATGIPEYRADHAVLMVRFATVCLHRITELTMTLQSALGPGTEELAMRFGIHSGPVTAGVLRGEKSRFQLFGDTMNVAARMESTGVRKKIHLSKESADLLIEAGKENWIEPREEIVTAKGKGELKTYWLKPECLSSKKGRPIQTHGPEMRQYEPATSKDSSGNDAEDQDVSTELTGIRTTVLDTHSRASSLLRSSSKNGAFGDNYKRLDRLVDWNVELLMNILKKIVARRSVVVGAKVVEKDPSQHGKIALDEIKEVIEMPEFNSQAAINMTSDSTVELPPEVRSELKAFVHRIASHYEDNPFHNFEHASHVAMSAVKLLKRIVMSDNVDYRRDSKQKETEKVKAIAKDLHQATYGISSDPVTQFSTVFSALIHDVGHTGVPNGQLAKEEPDTAERYRNKSIAEQRSVDMAWGILMEPDYENLRGAMFPTKFEMQHFRQLIVNSVLATDIFDKELSALRKARWQKAFHADELVVPIKESADDAFNRKATIVIEHIIQASDVAHTMQHWHVYQKWNERLFQEMYTAFREGRSDKDPSEGWYKGELWFFDNYVIPLAKKLNECGVFGVSSAEYLNYAVENRDEWERKGEEIVPCMVSNFESSRFA
jgi:class 3 adenylate cyclase